jgi:two-component system, cell cycle response regulator
MSREIKPPIASVCCHDDPLLTSPPSSRRGGTAPSVGRPILIADDDRVTRTHLAARLAGWGYAPQVVASGAEALAALAAPGGPSVAILDWEMPGLTGLQVCRALRGLPCYRYVYILMLTGHTEPRHVVEALDAGADDFIRKPFEQVELRSRVRAGMRLVELHARCLEVQQELERQALRDPLTGMANRYALRQSLDQELARHHRKGTPLSVIIFDIDNFKRTNDTFGHLVGDEVIQGVAAKGLESVRPYDTLGRYGGEEFLLIAPECSLDNAVNLAERIRLAIASSRLGAPRARVATTASFGVASTDQGHRDAASLVGAADAALYVAKRQGRNRTHAEAAPGAGASPCSNAKAI